MRHRVVPATGTFASHASACALWLEQGRKPYNYSSYGGTMSSSSAASTYTYKPRPEAALKIMTK